MIQCSAANRISAPRSFEAEGEISGDRTRILHREVEQVSAGWRNQVGEAGANSCKFKLATTAGYTCFQRQGIFIFEYYFNSGDRLIVIVSNLAANCVSP